MHRLLNIFALFVGLFSNFCCLNLDSAVFHWVHPVSYSEHYIGSFLLGLILSAQFARWCVKNVFKEIHEKPMCWKICATLENDLPEKSVAMHRRKLPATVLVPGIIGRLCQVNSFRQLGFVHSALMTTSVPFSVAVTLGLFSVRQKWQLE